MADTHGIRWVDTKSADRQGTGTLGQSFGGGSTTNGDVTIYDASGNVIDGGVLLSALATKAGVQGESYTYAADSGSANAYAVTLSPAPTVAAGSVVVLKVANTNTSSSTLAVNGGSATAIKKESAGSLVDLAAGDWSAGQIVLVISDGTVWQWTGGGSQSTGLFLALNYWPGPPDASQIVLAVDIPSNLSTVSFPGNFTGSVGKCGVNPTSTASYSIKQNGTTIGTMAISTSGTFTFSTVSGTPKAFAASDELTVVAPGTQDATLADVRFTLAGTR